VLFRSRMEPALAEKIRALAAGSLDWDFLLTQAAENSVTPLLARNLNAYAAEIVPPEQAQRLAEAVRASTARCLVLTAELIKIMDLFQSQKIAAIPYKGPVLAAQAYGDVALRQFEDLDVFLPQREMAKANEMMLALSYHGKFPWILSPRVPHSLVPCEYSYQEDSQRKLVELHTEFTVRYFPVSPDIADLSRRVVPVVLSGNQIGTFAPEDALPVLCIHGSKDFWERISWIADISELVQAHPQLNWDAVYSRAESCRARRMLHFGLALAVDLLGAPLPEEIASRVQNDRIAMQLASEVNQRHLRREPFALSTPARLSFRRRMIEGTMAGWRYSLRLAVTPAEEDWETIRLPRALAPLYIALRPLRLLRKYGWSAGRAAGSSS
jgi:hypothetical protein